MSSISFLDLMKYTVFTRNVTSTSEELAIDRQELPAITELWIEREWMELNNLQVYSKENIPGNVICEEQSLLGGGVCDSLLAFSGFLAFLDSAYADTLCRVNK